MNISEIKAWAKAAFDKIILFVALFGLLLSLILLILMVGRERQKLEDLSRKQERSRSLSQAARLLDMTFLDEGIEKLQTPEQIPAWSNRLMVAELRVSCVKCGRPIPVDADVCPFRNCGEQQPAVLRAQIKDSDLDGLPDEWELKYGLNPNADDALLTLYQSKPFSEFTYWSCHLFLYTESTLAKLAEKAGLRINYIKQVQRYNLANHLYWLSKGKPGGHKEWHFMDSDDLNSAYEKQLASIGGCDTLLGSLSIKES